MRTLLVIAAAAAACSKPAPAPPRSTPPTVSVVDLPDGGPDGIWMDYLLFDPRTNAVWAPGGNGAVAVFDVATGKLSTIGGFATTEVERRGKKRRVGPSSAALGPAGTVYVGSRGDFTVCAIDEKTLAKGACGTLDQMPDGLAYVAKTNEVWVTSPRDKSIRILDAATLAQKAKLDFDGEPEGFAPDPERGRFYTNLEDKDATLAIDLLSHQVVATWHPACGEEGPHGLTLADGKLVVACSAKVEVLDVARDGAVVGSVPTGDGVDNVDYAAASRVVYAGAAGAGTLTEARLEPTGALTPVATVPTRPGARNGVATADGRVYLADSQDSALVVVAGGR